MPNTDCVSEIPVVSAVPTIGLMAKDTLAVDRKDDVPDSRSGPDGLTSPSQASPVIETAFGADRLAVEPVDDPRRLLESAGVRWSNGATPLMETSVSTDTLLLTDLLIPILGANSLVVADRLHERFGSLGAIIAADETQLAAIPGVGHQAAHLLTLVYAIKCRVRLEALAQRDVISSPAALHDYVKAKLRFQRIELVVGLFLDANNRLLRREILSRGTLEHAPIHSREIVRKAIETNAKAVILVRNRPSADPKPSRDDVELTQQTVRALMPIEVHFHDHIIVAGDEIVSLRKLGLFSASWTIGIQVLCDLILPFLEFLTI